MPFLKSLSLCVTALLSGFTTVIGAPYPNSTAYATTNLGQWGPTIDFPLVPVAAALLPDTGKLLVWSAFNDSSFYVGKLGITQTAIYDPATGSVTQYTVNNTGHDMFCPGLSMNFYGKVMVTGGDTAGRTSIYSDTTNCWEEAADMLISRGYQSQTTLSDGTTFTIGGSFSGGSGGKIGEVYVPELNEWFPQPGCQAVVLTSGYRGWPRSSGPGRVSGEDPTRRNPMLAPRPIIV